MIIVNRSAKSYIPCWIISSSLYSTPTLPIDTVTSTWRDSSGSVGPITNSIDRNWTTRTWIGGNSFQYWNFKLVTGNTLLGCDQFVIISESKNRAPIPMTLTAQGVPGTLQFAVTDIAWKRNSGADFITIDHDRSYPTTGFSFNTSANTSLLLIRDFIPLGGTRRYRKVYRTADSSKYFADPRGRLSLVVNQNEIVSDSMILPNIPHTLNKLDDENWEAVLIDQSPIVPKTSWDSYSPGSNALTFAEHATVKASWAQLNVNYWINIAGESPILLYATADGWYNIAGSLANGAVGNMTHSNIVTLGTNRILSKTALAKLNPSEIRINGGGATIRTTSTIVIDRLKSAMSLTYFIGEHSLWINDTPTVCNIDILDNPWDKPINTKIYHAAGNTTGLQWFPEVHGSTAKLGGTKAQFYLAIKHV